MRKVKDSITAGRAKKSGFGSCTDDWAGGSAGRPADAGRSEYGRQVSELVGNLVQLHKLHGSLLAKLQKKTWCAG